MGNRAVFFDRDGTLIEHYDYLTHPSQVELLPKAASALKFLRERGFTLVMVTNQSAIARGMLTEHQLKAIHNRMEALLTKQGTYLDRIYYCPYHPEGTVEKYRQDSTLRKPQPGMLRLAAEQLDIDLSRSWMIGDDDRDIEAGLAAGCKTIMLVSHGSPLVRKGAVQADFEAVNLQAAANIVAHYADMTPVEKNVPAAEVIQGNSETDSKPDDNTGVDMPDDIAAYRQVDTPQPSQPQPETNKPDDTEITDTTVSQNQLSQILRELKSMNRQRSIGGDFSIFKLMAGVVQMVVILCLIIAFLFGTSAQPQPGSVQSALSAALVFQTMVVALLMLSKN
jgi:D-glycero-D-manno-heptose 1,7-bisphosphate phosphatase